MIGSGLGASREGILEHLKRRGASTIPAIAVDVGLNVETVRAHMRVLDGEGLVQRGGSRPKGPGRPEIVYALTAAAESLFPNRDGELLFQLADYVRTSDRPELLREFFAERVARRRREAGRRLEGLEGDDRLEEVARILSEDGFMAEIDRDDAGRRLLRLCHCPMPHLVAATRVPCREELRFVREMLGESLARVSYIPAGDAACCYALGHT
jgi:predicted ArsR family transcriptional regulator